MSISITIGNKATSTLLAIPAKGKVAIRRAINRTVGSGQTVAKRMIATEIGLPQREVAEVLKKREATDADLSAALYANKKRIRLAKFKLRGPMPSRGRGNGLSVRIGTRSSRIPSAFLAEINGSPAALVRVGSSVRKSAGAWSKNLPVKQLYGPSIGGILKKFKPDITARMNERLPIELEHQLQYVGIDGIDVKALGGAFE